MSPKRPAQTTRSSSPASSSQTPSSSGSSEPSAKRQRTRSSSSSLPIKVYIVEAKFDDKTFSELVFLVESHSHRHNVGSTAGTADAVEDNRKDHHLHLTLCSDVREADVVVTAVQMRKRLERHIDWTLAKKKAIVTPQWLLDSVKYDRAMPCGDYYALSQLHDETARNCPDNDGNEFIPSSPPAGSSSKSPMSPLPPPPVIVPNKTKLSYKSRYACARASPLICPNQELAEQFDVIRRSRVLEGEDISALTYARAVAVIKAYPYPITRRRLTKEIPELPYIGPKKSSMIHEYVTQGFITESKSILESSRFQSLSALSTIHGIGATTARKLYSLGLRTLEDLERYYEVEKETTETEQVRTVVEKVVNREEEDIDSVQAGLMDVSIKLALALRHDFAEKISRTEVEEIHQIVMAELEHVEKGCMSTIVGGYRRGRPECSDVDIVISHPHSKKAIDIGRRLVKRLYEQGFVTHVMHLSGFHKPQSLRTTKGTIETVLTVFVLPANGTRRRAHRRLDLIFALPEVYWTTVTGWTGSTMFQRDLRLWCKERGLKFDSSGITRRHDSKRFYPRSELELFEMLGLEWIDPTLRNADM